MQRLHIIIYDSVHSGPCCWYQVSRFQTVSLNTYIFQETDSYFDSWKIVADSGTLPEPEKYDTTQRAD